MSQNNGEDLDAGNNDEGKNEFVLMMERAKQAVIEGKVDELRALFEESKRFSPNDESIAEALQLPKESNKTLAASWLAHAASPGGRTLLHHLVDWPGRRPKALETFEILVKEGADINRPTPGNESPLRWAVSAYDDVLTTALLDAGAHVDGDVVEYTDATGGKGNRRGRQPLSQAIFYSSGKCADILVSRGASIFFCAAAGLGRVDLLEKWYIDPSTSPTEASAWQLRDDLHFPPVTKVTPDDPSEPKDNILNKAVIFAVMGSQPEALKWLTTKGADLSHGVSGFDGRVTPLHRAASRNLPDMIELLLKLGAVATIKDSEYESTPYGWARFLKKEEAVAAFERCGVNS